MDTARRRPVRTALVACGLLAVLSSAPVSSEPAAPAPRTAEATPYRPLPPNSAAYAMAIATGMYVDAGHVTADVLNKGELSVSAVASAAGDSGSAYAYAPRFGQSSLGPSY